MDQLPLYILCEHSATHAGPPSNALAHPAIQYHYADDSPLALWPQHPNEHVLVLDHDPTNPFQPKVQCMSKDLAVVSLRIEEAPGAAAADGDRPRSDRMYIIQTTATDNVVDLPHTDRKSAHTVLAQYKRRNATLRRVLLYPDTSEELSPRPDTLP